MHTAYKVNLLPARLQREGNVDVRRLMKVGGATLLIGLTLGGYGAFMANFYFMRNDLAETKQQLASLAPLVARVEEMRKERKELEASLAEYNAILKKQLAWSALLLDLGDIAPIDLWLVDLEILNKPVDSKAQGGAAPVQEAKEPEAETGKTAEGGTNAKTPVKSDKSKDPDAVPRPNTILFKGYARTMPSIGVFMNNLTRLPYFDEVKLNKISSEEEGIRFEITTTLKDES